MSDVAQTVTPARRGSRSEKAQQAAALLAEDKLTDAEIAGQLGISHRTLKRLKHDPGFALLMAEAEAELQKAALRFPIARKLERMRSLNRQWERMNQVFEARAAVKPQKGGKELAVPGIETGLVWAETKLTAGGDAVEVWGIDAALMREYRETLKHAAIEAGDWSEKRDIRIEPSAFLEKARQLGREHGVEEAEAVAIAQEILRNRV